MGALFYILEDDSSPGRIGRIEFDRSAPKVSGLKFLKLIKCQGLVLVDDMLAGGRRAVGVPIFAQHLERGGGALDGASESEQRGRGVGDGRKNCGGNNVGDHEARFNL